MLTLESSPLKPGPEHVLRVEMIYAPVNPSDLIPMTGAYSHLITLPMIAGYEGVGRVISAPPGMTRMLGRRVLPLRGAGTWQRYVDCDPAIAVPVPDDIPDTLAARAYINPLSAVCMLRNWPVCDRRIAVTGAGSSIAALLAQWAQADGAANVSGIYRSPQRRTWLEDLGVGPVSENDPASIEACARQADIVFDSVGGTLGSAILSAMRPGTEFVSYGLLSGQPVLPSPGARAAHRRFHLRDVLRNLSTPAWQESFSPLWPRLRAAKMPGVEIFPVEFWRDALDAFHTPGRRQKPLLEFNGVVA
ncbi:MAG: zinc-dependent alcohol dehydrogenase family protein [Rhodobacter sp.]|nr:zinc-dependent alcohol dehydrogenase family protein [Rhodobacter sp.]